MKRRPRASRNSAPSQGTAARRKPLNRYTAPEHDPLSDSRLRPLVERYASLAGATLEEVGAHVVEMEVPEEDRSFFGDRKQVLLAFAVGAAEHLPDAQMAVVGSPFVDQLLAAIRARGARLSLGLVGASSFDEETTPPLAVPVRNASVGAPTVRVGRHPVGRLLARVLIRAGASVEEHLVESKFFDLATGTLLPRDAAQLCAIAEQNGSGGAKRDKKRAIKAAAARPAAELVKLMTGDLQARLSSRVNQLRAESMRALEAELERIDAYYKELLESVGAKESDGIAMADAGRAIQAEHTRRRLEEERRHQVHVVVHPLQMIEMEMIIQRAEWKITTSKGRSATLVAPRAVSGPDGWSLACPACGCTPSELVVCRDNSVACDSCADDCSVCLEGFRVGDGTAVCHVDDAPACPSHRRTCSSCDRVHCSAHEGECADGAHAACASCLAPCGQCQRVVCASHAVGDRRLCSRCVVYCEGKRSEPVGRDEAVECATCDRFVCEKHQATCEVDGKVHCSNHLVRTDQSRRLVCQTDRSSCAHEADAIFAADEVAVCPVCARQACSMHMHDCKRCGRRVCVGEWEAESSLCAPCRQ